MYAPRSAMSLATGVVDQVAVLDGAHAGADWRAGSLSAE